MNFEILVEGQCEKTVLSILMEKIVGPFKKPHTWKIHEHQGVGKLPVDPKSPTNKKDRTLLHNLPRRLQGYGKEEKPDDVIVVLVDLDDRKDCRAFKNELVALLMTCDPKPRCLFRIAIEELEAWFLGDREALKEAFPSASDQVLNTYIQDSQSGTWEKMAEALHPGGMAALVSKGKRSRVVLEQKIKWARKITPLMDVEKNISPSFVSFRDGLRKITTRGI